MTEITCIGDFLRVVKELSPQNKSVFYRGQRNSEYGINSSISRLLKSVKLNPISIKRYNTITRVFYDDEISKYHLASELYSTFREKHIVYPDVNIINGYSMNDIDLHVTAQHYGLSTRVIDWTYSPLIALYFATEKRKNNGIKYEDDSKDASVFMIWNEESNKLDVCSSDNFLKRIEAEKKIHKKISKDCESFYLTHRYKIYNMHDELERYVDELYNKLIDYTNHLEFGETIRLNSTDHLIDLVECRDNLNANEFIEKIFYFAVRFFNQSYNYSRPNATIDIFNDYNTIIEPLPINQRVKNQQGVLMFCKKVEDDVYPSSKFNEKNTINHIDDESLSEVSKNAGLLKIIIPKSSIKSIRKELELYGFSKDFVYPEIMSFTEYMQEKIISKHSI